MQLAMPDVDGKYHAGAVGEQHLGKTSGRCADVEADVVLDLQWILLQRACELDATARDEGMRRLRVQRRGDGEAAVFRDPGGIWPARAGGLAPPAGGEGVRGPRAKRRGGGDALGGLQALVAVGGDEPRLNRCLRARAAFEQAALDEQHIRAL